MHLDLLQLNNCYQQTHLISIALMPPKTQWAKFDSNVQIFPFGVQTPSHPRHASHTRAISTASICQIDTGPVWYKSTKLHTDDLRIPQKTRIYTKLPRGGFPWHPGMTQHRHSYTYEFLELHQGPVHLSSIPNIRRESPTQAHLKIHDDLSDLHRHPSYPQE